MRSLGKKLTSRVLLVGLILAAGVALITSATVALSRDSQEPNNDWVNSFQEDLRICVASIDIEDFDSAAARDQIIQALEKVREDPRWQERGYSQDPSTESGCPSDPYLLRPGVSVVDGVTDPSVPIVVPRVEEPSAYRLFVFVVPADELAAVIKGEHDVRATMQEAVCHQGGGCGAVSTGIYLSPDELEDEAFLIEWLTKGLSLERPVPQAPDIFQERGNPNSPKPE